MGTVNERPARGEGHDGESFCQSCWRTRRHLRRQQPRPLQIRRCRTELEGYGPPLARPRPCRWRGGACLPSGVIWKDVLLSCPYAGSKSITLQQPGEEAIKTSLFSFETSFSLLLPPSSERLIELHERQSLVEL